MSRACACRHQRTLSFFAFGLLALVTELIGRSVAQRFDVGRHTGAAGNPQADYYPFLLGAVKFGVALLLARLAWRVARAHTAERASRRLLAAVRAGHALNAPRIRLTLSPRLWLAFFATTAVIYLVQVDAEGLSAGRWPVLGPWLHTSALPAFAVLSVLAAVLWSAVQRWLADYERYAEAAFAHASRLARTGMLPPADPPAALDLTPRKLFGLAFESRPPPAPA
jgi:hypothetical protein